VSQLRPRIRPLDNIAASMEIYNSNYVYYPRPLLEYAWHAEEIFYAILTRAHTSIKTTKYFYVTKHHSVWSLVGIGTLLTPLTQASVPSPRTKGWGAHSPAAKGVGESQFRRLEKRNFAYSVIKTLGGGGGGGG
jgi:hypothetical protein